MTEKNQRTIAAIATPKGTGGIAVVRISGDSAFEIGEKIFAPIGKKYGGFADIPANTAVFGDIAGIDQGVAVKFFAPHSYTGEHTLEISCHGGAYISNAVLSAAISAGASPAAAGEFTKTAYLNGKITLTGAEAVGRLICAANKTGARLARAQLGGGLSKKIGAISDRIKDIISETYVYIDYPGEDLGDLAPGEMLLKLYAIKNELEELKDTYSLGKIISEGIDCAIVGRPNSGKSTLLNMLSGDEVAIVHDTPGTTRDVVYSRINTGEFVLNLHDTAGIREASSGIEGLGIEKTFAKIEECELVIGVFDSSDFGGGDLGIVEILKSEKAKGKKIIPVLNKCDIAGNINFAGIDFGGEPLAISAKNNAAYDSKISAFDAFANYLEAIYKPGDYAIDSGEVLTEQRQYAEICAACENLGFAVASLEGGFTQDVAGLDLELAAKNLDRCDSRDISADIVDRIFKNFCVGK
ncbi:MAG: tRNA uridine-5-carboxymethylaminomethyl(34) synthesis GTPase MnmE [Oscillospiraceae bacterium]|nr:tRNA uridine-5-carboxymethylaminomethyl(34) synthesis GTPase MnmE [Oscillospiraceae bacterium]